MWIVVRGSNAIKRLEAWAAPFLIVAGLALFAWATVSASGLGRMVQHATPVVHRDVSSFTAT